MREKKEKRVPGALSGALSGTPFVFPAGFHIEADGPGSLLVEGCTGIRLYEPECIKIGAGRQCVRITGDELVICSMFGSTLYVRGRIASIEFI